MCASYIEAAIASVEELMPCMEDATALIEVVIDHMALAKAYTLPYAIYT